MRDDGVNELGHFIPDENAEDPVARIEETLRAGDLERLLSTLDERSRFVITMRFGLDGGDPRTLDEIGRLFGVTRERVRQLEARALDRMARHAAADALR